MVRDRGELVEDYPGMCQKHSGFSPEIWVLGNGIKWGGSVFLIWRWGVPAMESG